MGYNSQRSFAKFKNNDEFKELSLDSMYKKLNDFFKKINRLKNVTPQTDENKVLKLNVLDDTGDVFNKLYYIYKDKYNEEKDGLNAKKKSFDNKKLRLWNWNSEEQKQQQQKTSKKIDKKEPPKNPMKDDLKEFNEWINREEIDINPELF